MPRRRRPASSGPDTAGLHYPAPVGDVLLGDGFFGYYDPAAKLLRLTRLYNQVVDDLDPVRGVAPRRRPTPRGVTWTVDRRSNKVAYVDADDTVHVVGAYDYTWLPSPAHRAGLPPPACSGRRPAALGGTAADGLSKPASFWK
ncbi:hypothetical protein LT493_44410 [Streptomyces tricolor]|nr:hypothetical protein [Streptomyces tricolor]